MNKSDQHKWQLEEVEENRKDTFTRKWRCIRGDCNCIKYKTRRAATLVYQRSGQLYGEDVPICYGDTPINEQGVD